MCGIKCNIFSFLQSLTINLIAVLRLVIQCAIRGSCLKQRFFTQIFIVSVLSYIVWIRFGLMVVFLTNNTQIKW